MVSLQRIRSRSLFSNWFYYKSVINKTRVLYKTQQHAARASTARALVEVGPASKFSGALSPYSREVHAQSIVYSAHIILIQKYYLMFFFHVLYYVTEKYSHPFVGVLAQNRQVQKSITCMYFTFHTYARRVRKGYQLWLMHKKLS